MPDTTLLEDLIQANREILTLRTEVNDLTDEIERLREALTQVSRSNNDLADENKRLNALLAELDEIISDVHFGVEDVLTVRRKLRDR